MAKIFYTSAPEAEGVFAAGSVNISDEYKKDISLYRFVQKKTGVAEFGLSKKKSAVKLALKNREALNFACLAENPDFENAQSITVLKSGIAELQPNGDWLVIKKSQIKYSAEEMDESSGLDTKTGISAVLAEADASTGNDGDLPLSIEINDNAAADSDSVSVETDTSAESNDNNFASVGGNKDAFAGIETGLQTEPVNNEANTAAMQEKSQDGANKSKPQLRAVAFSGRAEGKKPFPITIIIVAAIIGVVFIAAIVAYFVIREKQTPPYVRWYTNNIKDTSFTVSTAEELAMLAQIVNGKFGLWPGWWPKRDSFTGKTINLSGDIDLSQFNNWVPIGDHFADTNNVFLGTFNGGGHVISGLAINRLNADRQGLFGRIGRGGRVENLGLDGVNVKGRDYAGALAGIVDGQVSVCYSIGEVSGVNSAGGIVGALVDSGAVLTNCYSAADVSGEASVGGVAGQVLSGGTVTDSYFSGRVGGSRGVGGVAGRVGDIGRVAGSYSSGAVSGYDYVGGVAGQVISGSIVTGSYSTGAVTGKTFTGGVAGTVERNSKVANSYSTGIVNGGREAGGVVGQVSGNSSVVGSYSSSTVSASGYNGGIAGRVVEDSRVINCAALNQVLMAPVDSMGRIAGLFSQSKLSNNVAATEMKTAAIGFKWANKGLATVNGADIDTNAIKRDSSVGGRFTSANGWTLQGGSLPVFNITRLVPGRSAQPAVTVSAEAINRVADHALGEALNYLPDGAKVWIVNNEKHECDLINVVVDSMVVMFTNTGIDIVGLENSRQIKTQRLSGSLNDGDILKTGKQIGASTVVIVTLAGTGNDRRLQIKMLDVDGDTQLLQSDTDDSWRL